MVAFFEDRPYSAIRSCLDQFETVRKTPVAHDAWVDDFMARLAAFIRKLSEATK